MQAAAGVVLLLLGLALNPLTVRHLAADAHLARPWRVLAVEVLLLGAGGFALRRAAATRRRGTRVEARDALAAGATLTVSTLLALGLAEGFVRVAVDPLQYLSGDAWWEHRWRQADAARQARGDARYPFDEFDPERGWRVKPGFRSDEVRTNALGARADREVGLARTPGVRRIVLVGDSFTWGEDVSNPETFAHHLERRLERTEVVNLGVHGYGTDQQLLHLRGLGLRLRPDLVVLGLFEENVHRNLLSFRDYAKPRFVLEGGELRLVGVPVPSPRELRAREQAMPASRFAALVASGWRSLVDRTVLRTPLAEREEVALTLALVDEARRASEAAGARFLLMLIPGSDVESSLPLERRIARWASDSGTDHLGLAERFAAMPAKRRARLYVPEGHWTPEGHAAVASLLVEHLSGSGAAGSRALAPTSAPR